MLSQTTILFLFFDKKSKVAEMDEIHRKPFYFSASYPPFKRLVKKTIHSQTQKDNVEIEEYLLFLCHTLRFGIW